MWFLTVFGLMCRSSGDLAVVLAVRDQLQHLDLAVGELRADRRGVPRRRARRPHALEHLRRDHGRDERLALGGGADPAMSSSIEASFSR